MVARLLEFGQCPTMMQLVNPLLPLQAPSWSGCPAIYVALTAAQILKHGTFGLRHWLPPTPWLRNLARSFFWDLLGQNDNILVVASRCW